ncbi:transposase [Saccharopolyspora erythraea]|uniref:IS701 family transposase n=1 Tax=Saccharopolyspora erythraea TaxID=1836 RepID=UPI001BAB8387|nr:transposase [Saccharopolyspora erythraea]
MPHMGAPLPRSASPMPREAVLTELCESLFAPLPRSDQRSKGVQYVRGLLSASGRKSIRNIAAATGGSASEQGLHHFVSSSTWDWAPVRHALARHVVRTRPPRAWVVRPVVIPKTGRHSVGVERRFFPSAGRVLNAQQAVGVWAASEVRCDPVEWRLRLSERWLSDAARRARAAIPREIEPETLGDCTIAAYLTAMCRGGLPRLPVISDGRDTDPFAMTRALQMTGTPSLTRIAGSLPLVVTDPTAGPRGAEPRPAKHIANAAKARRRPAAGTTLAAGVRVRMPGGAGRFQRDDLLLLAVGEVGAPWAGELWLTDLVDLAPSELLRLSRLLRRVESDFTGITEQVGIMDFAGQSFDGWHRHATLSSMAHAATALDDRDRSALTCAS